MISFGVYPAVSLTQARKLRHQAYALLAQDIDPLAHKRAQQHEIKRVSQHTFYRVDTDGYAMKTSQGLAENTVKDIWRSLEKYVFPGIGNQPVSELTARQFVTLLKPLKTRGKIETLKRILQRINEIMDFAANSGLTETNPAANVRKAFPSPR